MRPDISNRSPRLRHGVLAGVPAVAGSIALALSAAPAQAVGGEREDQRMPRPADSRHAGLAGAGAGSAIARSAVAAASTPSSYEVRPGDTVSGIAARFGLRTADVLAINGLSWSSVIHPGQVLRLTAAPPSAAPATPAAESGAYVVVRGDTVSGIARRHGVSVASILSANGLGWSSIIYPGQTLAIPGTPVLASATKPVAPPPPAPAPAAATHLVVAGDTVTAIAQRHGVSVPSVLSANGLSPSSIIYPGQQLSIPVAAGPAEAGALAGLDAEQAANARLIIRIGRELGVPDRGIAIALGTAMQESWIRNLDWGDRDSLGLFQQRPSTGWGTADQVRDPAWAIAAFYGGRSDPNGTRTRGLLDIPGWEDLSFAEAAQAVQISAYPDRYARWEKPAYAWLAALG